LAAVVTVRQHLSRCVPGVTIKAAPEHGRPRSHGCCGPRRL